jgi:UDP-glucose 4-epimerase
MIPKTFAVTGGAGFIGSHVSDALLAEGHRVRILDDLSTGRVEHLDPRCELIVGDVADPAAVARLLSGTSGCFHLAAIASVSRANEDWLGAHRVNLTGTVTVFDAARRHGRLPVVFASSAAVYGDLRGAIASEDAVAVPTTAYGADKLGSELHARAAFLVHGVPTLGLRLFNVYGPRQDPTSRYSGVISIFARILAEGLPLTIDGDGAQTRDFVHVRDVVRHFLAAMRHLHDAPGAAVLNVCTGQAVSVRELAQTMAALLRRTPRFVAGAARSGDIRHSLGDPSRAIALLGTSAQVRLEEGLASLPSMQRAWVTEQAA